MQAVVLREQSVRVEQVEDPYLEKPTDVIVRITSTGMGHENLGVIEQVGLAVTGLRKGDRVVMPFNVACGTCFNCARGETHACLTADPDDARMGPFRGGQAELLRVPFADFNCLKLPGHPGDELEDDFLLLSDVFPTGYHATELAGVRPGSTVAVFGAGPVGLLAAYSAQLRGAAEVYVVDSVKERLAKARELGAIPIDFTQGSPAKQIKDLRRNNPLITGAMRPGEEKMIGVSCGIDAAGHQARDIRDPSGEHPSQVLTELVEVVNPTGRIGIVGASLAPGPGAASQDARQGRLVLPWADVFDKGITVGCGQCPVKRYNVFLRDLIVAGRATPSFIVSHRLPLSAAPDAYQKLDRRADGYTKVILKPSMRAPGARA